MRRFLPELLALPILPFLLLQGRATRRRTPRLPPAQGPEQGVAGKKFAGPSLSLVAVGESPVAGVGVSSHAEAITAQLAQALSGRLQRPIAWQAHGRNGITIGEAREQLLPAVAGKADIALVAFGVNDTTAFRSAARWQGDLQAFLQDLQQRCTPRLILLAGVPQMARFPALPWPLRWIIGLKAATLDRVAREVAATLPHVHHVPLTIDPADPGLMAVDGYHPSARGCIAWATVLAHVCVSGLPSPEPVVGANWIKPGA